MIRKLMLTSLACVIFGMLMGSPTDANGTVSQSLAVIVKQDPGGGFTNADLNGRFYLRRIGIHNFETSYREAEICYGYVDFNGAGSWSGQATCFDSDGTSSSPPSFNGTYSVNTNGSFTFIFDEDIDTGYISSDRNFAILSDGVINNGSTSQGLVTALKISDSPLSLSDLNGTWRFHDLEFHNFENVNVSAVTCAGTLSCNNGNWNASIECLDSDGSTDTNTDAGTYAVNGKAFDFYETGHTDVLLSAYQSIDKNTFIYTRSSISESEFYKGIAVKEGAKTYTNADLSGTYFMHMMYINDIETNDREAGINHGTMTFNGAGNWTFSGQNFESDRPSWSPATASGTNSVKSDGSYTAINTSETPNQTVIGYISGDDSISMFGSGGKVGEEVKSKAMPWIPLLLLDK